MSYGLLLTRVIERMDAVRLNTVKAGPEYSQWNAVRGQGRT